MHLVKQAKLIWQQLLCLHIANIENYAGRREKSR